MRVKDASPEDLFRRLAEVTGGEWSLKEDVYRLALGGGVDARERRNEAVARGERALKEARERTDLRTKGPIPYDTNGALDALILNLQAETLGNLLPGERMVLSTRPTPVQRAFARNALGGVGLSALPRAEPFRFGDAPAATPGPIEIVQFAIQPDSEGRSLFATLIAADARGVIVGGATNQFRWEDDAAPPEGDPSRMPRTSATLRVSDEDRKRAAALSAAGAATTSYGSGMEEGGSVILYSDDELSNAPAIDVLPELLDPERRDPLDLVAAPLLAALAESQGENLVAVVPDEAFSGAADLLARKDVDASTVVREAWRTMGVACGNEAGWLLVRPRHPAAARAHRLDRAALGTALRTLAKHGRLDLDAQAAYAAAQPLVLARESFEAPTFAAVNLDYGKRIARSVSGGERTLLRLYRALKTVRKGEPKAFGNLPSPARALLSELVYDGYSGPTRSYRYATPTSEGTASYPGGPYSIPPLLDLERTVYWPRGIPSDALVTLEDRERPFVFGIAPNGLAIRMSEGMSGYGMRQAENATIVTSTSLPRLARYARGTGRIFTVSISGDPMVFYTRSLKTGAPDPLSPSLGFDDLPEDLRRRIEESEAGLRRMREEYENRRDRPNGPERA